MKKLIVLLSMVGSLAISPVTQAVPTNQGEFNAIVDEIGVLTAYRAVATAVPLGTLGFDISLEGTSGTFEGSDIVLPKIKFQKGLPAGFDIAGYYSSFELPGNAPTTAYGAAVTYAILKGSATSPAWNIIGSYANSDISGIVKTNTTAFDTTLSKGFGPISPYIGIGTLSLNGTDNTATYNDYSSTKTRFFYGLSFDALAFNFTIEGEDVDGVNAYSVKIGFRVGD